ncbi:MAG TPA: PilZ domain-containing protein [Polyangiaceae bacterium]|nr:PilZ domain-containing protein [Polyangiaceae bacterium]
MHRLSAAVGDGPQTPDTFFKSVRDAFQENEDHAGTVGQALLAVALVGLLVGLMLPTLRRRRDRSLQERAFARLVREKRLGAEDVALVETLARHAGTLPIVVATHLDVFERATAAELRGLPPKLRVRDGDLAARVHHLRGRFGFANRGPEEPLLTTRELSPGTALEVLGLKTAVATVTEAFYTVKLRERPNAETGRKVPVTVLSEHGASHSVASPLLAVEPFEDHFTLYFAHDEAPERQQHRSFVRVPATGLVRLELLGESGSRWLPGELSDVSLHGAAVVLEEKLAVRDRLRASFVFRDERFTAVEAQVLACEGPPGGPYRVRLEFLSLAAAEDRRLAAAIAGATTRRSSVPESLRPGGRSVSP